MSFLWISAFAMFLCAASFAGTLVVYNNADNGAGSLRQAITSNNALGGNNTIVFSNIVTGTITLLSGDLGINKNVTITGPGINVLTISGNNVQRIFSVTNATATISGLTLIKGTNYFGGAVYGEGSSITMSDCVVSNNTASYGGGIGHFGGALTLLNCSVSSNTAMASGGGLMLEANTTAAIRNCSVFGNSGPVSGGGGLFNAGATLALNNCTFFGNSTAPGGSGGALFNFQGTSAVTNCTLVGNTARYGGGATAQMGSITFRNTIIAGNSSTLIGAGYSPDCYSFINSAGFNFVGNATNSGGWGALGDQVGTTASPLNPGLGPLKDNGGPTWTMAPLPGSLVIDQGQSSGATNDQRGFPRPFDNPFVPNAPGGDGSDIGAFEGTTNILTVVNNNDNGPGSLRQAILDAVQGDFDSIIFASNVTGTIPLTTGELAVSQDLNILGPGAATLAISAGGHSRVFEILGGHVTFSGLTIRDGRFIGSVGSFEQNGAEARGGGVFNQAILTLSDCVVLSNSVTGGMGGQTDSGSAGNGGNGLGGGIASIGTLSLTRCTLAANSGSGGPGGIATSGGSPGMGGQGYGGALYNEGTVNLTNCAITYNTALAGSGVGGVGTGAGGGVYNFQSVGLFTCTVASNTATGSSFDLGGGIYDNGTTLLIRNATISGNLAAFGGGLYTAGADLGGTIVAGNSIISGGGSPDASGTINSSDYNLIQNTNGVTINGTTSHNIVNQDPKLGALQANGGPTVTMPLLAGSPAIDKGTRFGTITDQRGRPRPFDFPLIPNAGGGDGSDIGAFEVNPPILAISRSASDVLLSWSTNDSGYSLEAKTNLNPSVTWSAVTNSPVIISGHYSVTDSNIGVKFYRLKSQ